MAYGNVESTACRKTLVKPQVHFVSVCVGSRGWVTLLDIQRLLLVLSSGITPGGAQMTICDAGY